MTERAEKALKRASTIIALSLTVISIIVGGYKVVDTSNRAIALAEVVQARIETEKTERQSADMVLDKAIVAELGVGIPETMEAFSSTEQAYMFVKEYNMVGEDTIDDL